MNKKRHRKEKNKNSKNNSIKSENSDKNSINKMDEEDDDEKNKDNELFNCVFIFSCILPDYFFMIKNLILPNFISENLSLNGLTDLIICQREDVGTTLKVENDDENKIFGIFTLIPFPFYKENPSVTQFTTMLKSKIQTINDNNLKITLMSILNNKKLGLLINDRFINLPEPLISPSLNFVINEIDECVDIANDKNNKDISIEEKNKYNLDYILIYSRYVLKDMKENYIEGKNEKYNDDNNYINLVINENNNKKIKIDEKDFKLYYKYEMEYFIRKADYSFDYKLCGGIYDSSSIYFDKNNREKQYMKIIFITKKNFYEVINQLNKK